MDDSPRIVSIQDLRRVLGGILLVSGALHAALMGLAVATALRWVHLGISTEAWHILYLAHFLVTLTAGAWWLYQSRFLEHGYIVQQVIDLLLGVFLQQLLFGVIRRGIAAGWLSPWFALAPSAFLLYYGYRIRTGRQIWEKLELF